MLKVVIENDLFAIAKWEEVDLDKAYELWLNPNVTKYISKNGLFDKDDVEKSLVL